MTGKLLSEYPWVGEKISYSLWLHTLGRLLALFKRLSVFGVENIPGEGGVLIVSNHRSYFDPPLIAYAVRNRTVFFMAKRELFDMPVLGLLVKHWGNAFPVERGKFDIVAIKSALKIVSAGEALCVFPEGTRSRTGKFLRPKWGAGMIALKTDAPIVPCLIIYEERGATVRFGKPFSIDLKDSRENYKRAADILMEKIKSLKE